MTNLPRRTGIFPGWLVVAAAFSILLFAYGLQFSYGVFITGMTAELGWGRAEMSLPYSIYVFAYSVFSFFTGRATDRFGPRRVISTGALLLGLGWGLSAAVTQLWQLNLTLGLIAALGMSVAWVPCNATVARWFTRRRGLAVAIASTGTSVGNLVVPTVAAALVAAWGWRTALAGLALATAVLILFAARKMQRDPESAGCWPDDDPAPLTPAPIAASADLRSVVRTEPFILLCAIYLATWFMVFVPFVHAVPLAEDLGLSKLVGATIVSAIGIGGIGGRLLSGVMLDRLGRMPTLVVIFSLQSVAFALFAGASTLHLLWVAATLFGFGYGGGVTVLAPLCSELFGRANVASIVGTIFAVASTPSGFGTYLAGWLFDATGGYGPAFLLAGGLNALALLLSLRLLRH